MGVLAWVIFGAVAGWLASIVVGTNAAQGSIENIVVGILGAILGGYIMSLLGKTGLTGFNVRSLAVAVLGSIVLLSVFNLVR